MKLVAAVSSSMSNTRAPASRASTRLAAWDVEPDASSVQNRTVSRPRGKWLMNGEMFTFSTRRPSSARMATVAGSETTSCRPSSGRWS
jgi:hypothetical protein